MKLKNKIRNFGVIILVVIAFVFLPSMVNGEKKDFFADFSINFFSNSNADFRDEYRSLVMVPEISIGVFFSNKLYIFGGFELFKVKGKTPEWNLDLEMKQRIFSLGTGYFHSFSKKMGLRGEFGIVSVSYTEKLLALKLENKGSCIGFRLNTKLQYKISSLTDLYFKLGYTIAKDTVGDTKNNFGGFSTGFGVNFSF